MESATRNIHSTAELIMEGVRDWSKVLAKLFSWSMDFDKIGSVLKMAAF